MQIATQVDAIFRHCLYDDDEIQANTPPADAVIVHGIVRSYGFHPGRLNDHKEEIRKILDQMPIEFHAAGGGGWTFLNLCNTRSGEQWGEHPTMEQLVVLAIGSKMGQYTLPRDIWSILPGSMPYVVFNTLNEYCCIKDGKGFHEPNCQERKPVEPGSGS